MYRKILVAVDGSRHASAALALAVDLARRYGASLCLLHAFPHVSDLLGTPYHEDLLAARTTIGRQLLEAARLQTSEAVPIETQLVEGPPAPAILRAAQEGPYDLIVLGRAATARSPVCCWGALVAPSRSTLVARC